METTLLPTKVSETCTTIDFETKSFILSSSSEHYENHLPDVSVLLNARNSKCIYATDVPLTGETIWHASHNLNNILPSFVASLEQNKSFFLGSNNNNNNIQPSKQLRVMEVGSGTGFSGIYFAKYFRLAYPNARLHVHMTDGDSLVVKLLDENIRLNFVSKTTDANTTIISNSNSNSCKVNKNDIPINIPDNKIKTTTSKQTFSATTTTVDSNTAITTLSSSFYRWSNPPPTSTGDTIHNEYDIVLGADLLYGPDCDPLAMFLSVRSILSKPSKTNCKEESETSMDHLRRRKFDISSYCSEQQQGEEETIIILDQLPVVCDPTSTDIDHHHNHNTDKNKHRYDGGIFLLSISRRNVPLSSILSRRVQLMCGLSFVGVVDGSCLDLFDNVTEGCNDMWKDMVLMFQ